MKRRSASMAALALVAVLSLLIASPVSASPPRPKPHASTAEVPRPGGSITQIAVGLQWPELDPATDNQDAADAELLDAVYGELFELEPGGKIVPDEAKGDSFSDNHLQFNIFLRRHLVFSDGSPFTAQAVAASIKRDLNPACLCRSNFTAVSDITTSGKYEVSLHLSHPFSPILAAFIGEAPNWTVDPTALARMGEAAYAQHPLGAGPFTVVTNAASSSLVLTRNPRYFVPGKPYLSSLKFESAGTDQSAYSGLQAGDGQLWSGASTIPLLKQVKTAGRYAVDKSTATGFEFVNINTLAPPFNNILAREALAYATNPKALVSTLYGNLDQVTESPSAPGDVFYEPVVPGYRTYNLAKAKALVKELGGLSITLGTLDNTPQYENESTALAAEWAAAGIKTSIALNTLPETVEQMSTHHFEAMDLQWGEDIDNGINDPIFWSSTGAWSGVKDPSLDTLLEQGVSEAGSHARAKVFEKIASLISRQQYGVFLYSHPVYFVVDKQVGGISSTVPEVHVEELWRR